MVCVGCGLMMELTLMNSCCIIFWWTKLSVWCCGERALMAKFDAEAVYHSISVHPAHCFLLGMKWHGHWFGSYYWPPLCPIDLQHSCRSSGTDLAALLQGLQFVTLPGWLQYSWPPWLPTMCPGLEYFVTDLQAFEPPSSPWEVCKAYSCAYSVGHWVELPCPGCLASCW